MSCRQTHRKGEFQAGVGELICFPMTQAVIDPQSLFVRVSHIMKLYTVYTYITHTNIAIFWLLHVFIP